MCLGLDMRVYWRCVFWFVFLFLFFIFPFAVFYYESDTDPRLSKTLNPKPFLAALSYTAGFVIAAAAAVAVCFLFFRSLSLTLDEGICAQVVPSSKP